MAEIFETSDCRIPRRAQFSCLGAFSFTGTLDQVTGNNGCKRLFGPGDGPAGWVFDRNYAALFLHPPEQLAHPTLADAHPFSRFPLRHFPVSGSFQPVQPVPLLLAHRASVRAANASCFYDQVDSPSQPVNRDEAHSSGSVDRSANGPAQNL